MYRAKHYSLKTEICITIEDLFEKLMDATTRFMAKLIDWIDQEVEERGQNIKF